MKRKRLLLLLALLMTAATGAWAQSATTTYKVDLNDGTQNPATWQGKAGDATDFGNLPLQGVAEGQAVTLKYNGRLKVKNVTATYAVPWDGDLSKLTAESTAEFATATDGMTIKGTLAEGVNVKVSIAQGATVTLDGVTINGVSNKSYQWAGINCLGDATIILSGTNTVKGFHQKYPGIYVPENKTLTIQGSGSLTASSNGYGCGIGGGYQIPCGKIVIAGGTINANGGSGAAGIGNGFAAGCGNISITDGTITANGGDHAAGIGSGNNGSCVNISITGGTITANGGEFAAGIGTGDGGSCGTISITNGVTSVTATMGEYATYSIGAGSGGSCGTVTIGGTVYWQDHDAVGDGATYLAQATIVYPAPVVDLSTLTADYVAKDGDVLTNATTTHKVEIADGATVTLDGVTISGSEFCIKCLGDATIILKDGSTNSLTSSSQDYPALSIGDAGTTLTIQGSTGVLNVTSGEYCAGIGGGYSNTNSTCGNIRIEGGVITAQGGSGGAGIGSDCYPATCGDIIITGGKIVATGGTQAAGIGGGYGDTSPTSCGNITITDGVTSVTATAGAYAPYSIGKGGGGKASCGTIIIGCTLDTNDNPIGGTKYWEDNTAVGDGATYLAQAKIEYPAPAKAPATVTTAPTGAAIVGVGKTTALVSGGAADGGTLMYAVTTTNTKPTSTDGFSDAVPTAQTITASGKVYVWYYVKADDTHTDSEIAATAIEVPVADIIWDITNVSDLYVWGTDQYEKEGVKLSGNADQIEARYNNEGDPEVDGIIFEAFGSGGYTFTAPTGKAFTKIEMTLNGFEGWCDANLGSGWAFNADYETNIFTVTWTGSAASTVGLLTGADTFSGAPVKSIVFYLSEQAAKPAATVTTAPKGAAVVGVGKTTALVSGGAANGGTLMYAVTTTNTKPTSTAGFSDAVPTAQTITASGKVYVWYFVKADDTHTDSEIAATAIEVPVADIVWDITNISDLYADGYGESYEKEGVTLSANAPEIYAVFNNSGNPEVDGISFDIFNAYGGYTFTAPTGKKFTKIEMTLIGQGGWVNANLGSVWAFNWDFGTGIVTVTWKGSAASTVGLLTGTDDFSGTNAKSIAFYLSE